jgi:uncharacterized protein DUF5715
MREAMDDRPRRRIRRHHFYAMLLLLAVIVAAPFWLRGDRCTPPVQNRPAAAVSPEATTPGAPPSASLAASPSSGVTEVPSPAATAPTEPYDVAHARVEEDRGQPMGLAARVTVPAQLQHYSDRRRFLAVQMADSREEQYALPQDDADLVAMLRAGTLVEMPPLTGEYILYDVGSDASDDPMAAYDASARKDIPLFASAAQLDAERARLAERAQRAPGRRARAAAEARAHFLSSYYDDPPKREELLRKGADMAALAASFGGESYDLGDPAARARLDARLLSLTRPGTRDVILDLAREYHQRFGRLLPVTSLVRTERYQRRLGRVNANATHVDIPPHTTGCAFDISYRYMPADEQQFLLDRVAQLEDEGKVEALRERRNHIHVFVFQDGRRPPEELVAQFLDEVDASHGIVRDASGVVVRSPRRGGRGARAR